MKWNKGRSAAPFAKACLRHLSLLRSYFAHRVALISSLADNASRISSGDRFPGRIPSIKACLVDIISDKMITTRSVPPELQPKVEAARIDLFESGKYGKIGIQETDLYLEDFIEKIKTQDRINGLTISLSSTYVTATV